MGKLTDIYNFQPIAEDLLTSGQPSEEQFSDLAAAGVKAVINLALSTSSNALAHEPEIVKRLGMQHYHIPVEWDNPTASALQQFMDTMDSLKGQKVLIHCAANMRVPTFLALYRILRLGWKHDKAFAEVYKIWNPYDDAGWSKFINKVLAGVK